MMAKSCLADLQIILSISLLVFLQRYSMIFETSYGKRYTFFIYSRYWWTLVKLWKYPKDRNQRLSKTSPPKNTLYVGHYIYTKLSQYTNNSHSPEYNTIDFQRAKIKKKHFGRYASHLDEVATKCINLNTVFREICEWHLPQQNMVFAINRFNY